MAEETILTREAKAELLRKAGRNPYPTKVDAGIGLGAYIAKYGALQPGETRDDTAIVAGRVVGIRNVGGVGFVDVMQEHNYLQLYLRKDKLGSEYDILFNAIDRGDWVWASGRPCKTKRGELSLLVDSWSMMSKAVK